MVGLGSWTQRTRAIGWGDSKVVFTFSITPVFLNKHLRWLNQNCRPTVGLISTLHSLSGKLSGLGPMSLGLQYPIKRTSLPLTWFRCVHPQWPAILESRGVPRFVHKITFLFVRVTILTKGIAFLLPFIRLKIPNKGRSLSTTLSSHPISPFSSNTKKK